MAKLVPRDWKTSEYGSHLHLLREVFRAFNPKTVLETGSGRYSTPFFLSRKIDRLVSIENDPTWAVHRDDPRHQMVLVDGPVYNYLPDPIDFDLVFVDDDPIESRERTIRTVLARATGLVVVHDTDYEPYFNIVDRRANRTDIRHRPHTTALCPTDREDFHAWLATS